MRANLSTGAPPEPGPPRSLGYGCLARALQRRIRLPNRVQVRDRGGPKSTHTGARRCRAARRVARPIEHICFAILFWRRDGPAPHQQNSPSRVSRQAAVPIVDLNHAKLSALGAQCATDPHFPEPPVVRLKSP